MEPRKWRVFALLAIALLYAGRASSGGGYFLSPELLAKIQPGTSNAQQVRETLGAPLKTMKFPRLQQEVMQYETTEFSDVFDIFITLDNDGVVREIQKTKRLRGP